MVGLALALTACSADRIERGIFHSGKGYQVTLPPGAWRVERDGEADLALRREEPPAGMLANATCSGREPARPLRALSRHLLFGLTHRSTVEEAPITVAGRSGVRSVVRGERDGRQVAVDAVVLKDDRCVYDFLYVAPVGEFESGRPAFAAFLESFAPEREATR